MTIALPSVAPTKSSARGIAWTKQQEKKLSSLKIFACYDGLGLLANVLKKKTLQGKKRGHRVLTELIVVNTFSTGKVGTLEPGECVEASDDNEPSK